MKKYIYALLFFGLILNISCGKEPVTLPSDVELGTTLIYLNGEEVDYKLRVTINDFHNTLSLGFTKDINICGFSWMKIEEGRNKLHDERELFIGAKTSFSQVISDYQEGYSYELINAENGYMIIDKLDLNAEVIAGSFLAEFKRTKKNGNSNTGLPKKILIQGVFHEEF